MSSFEERARARRAWPVRSFALRDEPLTSPLDASTVDERIAWVAVLTAEQWAFAGLEIPQYARSEMPGRVIRRGR